MADDRHNSNVADTESVAADQLKSVVERIERLEEDKKAIADDIKEVYGEAKANGFDTAILRKIVSLRKKPAAERAEEDAILELYWQALESEATNHRRQASAPGASAARPETRSAPLSREPDPKIVSDPVPDAAPGLDEGASPPSHIPPEMALLTVTSETPNSEASGTEREVLAEPPAGNSADLATERNDGRVGDGSGGCSPSSNGAEPSSPSPWPGIDVPDGHLVTIRTPGGGSASVPLGDLKAGADQARAH